MRQTWSNGRRRLVPSPGRIAQTNDLGQFRIYGLPPGDYYVSATLRSGLSIGDMEVTMMEGGIRTGNFLTSPTEPRSGYASTYYPGTPNAAEAQKIALAAGQDMSGADFALLPVRLAKVTGIVVGADGKPLDGAGVTLVPAQRDLAGLLASPSARSGKDGSFTLNSVTPGEYTLQARSLQVITSTQGDSLMVLRATAMGGPGGADSEFGSTPISIGGDDLANVILVTSKGGTASGRVIFDGAPPASLTSIRVTSVAADQDGPAPGSMGAGLKEDATFELRGLAGTRLIRVAGAPPGWALKSVKLNGVDITDTGADFKPGESVSGLEVELTQRATSVTGTVSGADGSLLKDYTVVVFAESAELWRLPMTRWVSGSRPDQEGLFKFQNLPAGAYIAVAVEYLPMGEWGDPELLDRLRSKGKRFTLSDGGSQTLDLRLTTQF
jgi:Carboxypeptidase regulatory-like domain